MPRHSRTPPAAESSDERLAELQDAVQSLAYHVEVLREAIDEVREELAWALRNLDRFCNTPLHFVLKSMAADPTAPDWAKRLNLQPVPIGEKPQSLSDDTMDQLEMRLTHIASGQLELILSAFDDLRLQLLSAVRSSQPRKKPSGVLPLAVPAETSEIAAPVPENEITESIAAPPDAVEGEHVTPACGPPSPGQQRSLWE